MFSECADSRIEPEKRSKKQAESLVEPETIDKPPIGDSRLAKPKQYAEINRRASSAELRAAVETAREEGLHRLDERWRPTSALF